MRIATLTLGILCVSLSACDDGSKHSLQAEDAPAASATVSKRQEIDAPAKPATGASQDNVGAEDPVEVAAAGTKFDPPVSKGQIPEGAWYCDMGSVHYARRDKGDGKCALCGMKLKQAEKK